MFEVARRFLGASIYLCLISFTLACEKGIIEGEIGSNTSIQAAKLKRVSNKGILAVDLFGLSSTRPEFRTAATTNGRIFYASRSVKEGVELWSTNLSANNTVLVKDIIPGTNSSAPYDFLSLGNLVVFRATNAQGLDEIWSTDGSSIGTRRLITLPDSDWEVADMDVLNGNTLIIGLHKNQEWEEIWTSDGTPAGTSLVVSYDSSGGGFNGRYKFINYTAGPGFVAFTNIGDTTPGTWVTDGTLGGTSRITTGSSLTRGSSTANRSYFSSGSWQNLEVTDGVTVTQLVAGGIFDFSSVLSIGVGANDFVLGRGRNLYFTDGTVPGTSSVLSGTTIYWMIEYLGELYFFTNNGTDFELWKSDGTVPGTTLVKTLNGFIFDQSSYKMHVFNGMLYFTLQDPVNQNIQLWKSDGTNPGTQVFINLQAQNKTLLGHIVNTPTRLFYSAGKEADTNWFYTDGTSSTEVGPIDMKNSSMEVPSTLAKYGQYEIAYDADNLNIIEIEKLPSGVNTNRILVSNVGKFENHYSEEFGPKILGDEMIFGGEIAGDYAVWKLDLISGTPTKLYELNESGDWVREFAPFQSGFIFFISRSLFRHMYYTDMTPGGTIQVTSFGGYTQNVGPAQSFTIVENEIYIARRKTTSDSEIWVSDGTPGGTSLFFDPSPASDTYIGYLTYDNVSRFYFGVGTETWVSDKTVPGTVKIADASFLEGYVLNGQFLFAADEPATGAELWTSDGTVGGTMLLKDLSPGTDDTLSTYHFDHSIEYKNRLYFASRNGGIYRTDGTVAGTAEVFPAVEPSGGAHHQFFMGSHGETVYFGANINEERDKKVYKSSDGIQFTEVLGIDTAITSTQPWGQDDDKIYFLIGESYDGLEIWSLNKE